MHDLGFGATAISSTAVGGGVITLMVPLAVSPLSDRLGRKVVLVVGYALAIAAMLVLAVASSLLHFWLAFSVLGVQTIVYLAVGSAYGADVVPPGSLGRGLALYNAAMWMAGVSASP